MKNIGPHFEKVQYITTRKRYRQDKHDAHSLTAHCCKPQTETINRTEKSQLPHSCSENGMETAEQGWAHVKISKTDQETSIALQTLLKVKGDRTNVFTDPKLVGQIPSRTNILKKKQKSDYIKKQINTYKSTYKEQPRMGWLIDEFYQIVKE